MPKRVIASVTAAVLLGAGVAFAVALTPTASAGKICHGNSCHTTTSQTTSTATTTETVPTTTSATTTTSSTTTTTAAPPASSIYWGAYIDGNDTYGPSYGDAPWDSSTWNLFDAHAGKAPSIVHWGVPAPWTSSFNYQLSAHQTVLSNGALSLLDMNSGAVPLRDIASGKYDAAITLWAQQAQAFGHPFFLRWDWEMNGSWFGWGTTSSNGNTAADYVNAWRHMHDLFGQAGATNVTWVWCPNVAFSGSTSFSSLYPGDSYVDWTCLDGYNKGGSQWSGFSSIFGASYDALLQIAPSKPVMVGETGSAEAGGSKAAWISDAVGALPVRFPRVKAFVWFNWDITENGSTWPWQIESSSTAQSAFSTALASPYFIQAGGAASLPLLAPIAAPS